VLNSDYWAMKYHTMVEIYEKNPDDEVDVIPKLLALHKPYFTKPIGAKDDTEGYMACTVCLSQPTYDDEVKPTIYPCGTMEIMFNYFYRPQDV
jgi:hypothetical protein